MSDGLKDTNEIFTSVHPQTMEPKPDPTKHVKVSMKDETSFEILRCEGYHIVDGMIEFDCGSGNFEIVPREQLYRVTVTTNED